MSSPQSLADLFVDVLADMRRVRESIDNAHPERMQVRTLLSVAEEGIAQAFRQAQTLTDMAREIQEEHRKRAGP